LTAKSDGPGRHAATASITLNGESVAITLWRRSPAAVNKASYLRLYTGSRLVASLHEHALRAGRGVDEHDLGRLNTRIVKAVHGATR
jgi:hypothetical protein